MRIRTADPAHEDEAIGEALARAFHDDPVIGWLLPGGKGAALMFATLARYVHAVAEVAEAPDGGLAGVALWDPPGHRPDEDGAIPGFVAAMGDRVTYGIRLDETMAAHKPAAPYLYLAQIGTVPDLQGTGVGSALMRTGLARCDAERLPAYLESSKESNIPFYERHGFRVTERFTLPDGPPVWGMWREPATW